jgi:predicted secreted protein
MITKLKPLPLVCLIILLPLTLCDNTYSFSKAADQATVIVSKEQNGKEITVKIRDHILIELVELGSAGYTWNIDNLDSRYLEVVSENTKKGSEDKIGAPVIHVWYFKAKKPGSTEIRMNYYRKWEGIKNSKDYFFIKLKII